MLQAFLLYWRYAHWFDKTIASTLPEMLFVCAQERKIILSYLNFISINT